MREIGEEFVRLRKESRSGAWSALQERLMSNFGVLVPEAASMTDFFKLSMAIEEFLKTEQGSESRHPMQIFEEWLTVPSAPLASESDEDPDDTEPKGTIQ